MSCWTQRFSTLETASSNSVNAQRETRPVSSTSDPGYPTRYQYIGFTTGRRSRGMASSPSARRDPGTWPRGGQFDILCRRIIRPEAALSEPPSPQVALARRGRAIGATVLAIFGGVWLGLWNHRAAPARLWMYGVIGAVALAILLLARDHYRRCEADPAGWAETPGQRRRQRWFHIINVLQWVLILVVGNVLANLGLGSWVIPAVILIVGLHFLPLARVLSNPVHYATGTAFILLAAVYPFIAAGGPEDPVGCQGAGLILWVSALAALVRR